MPSSPARIAVRAVARRSAARYPSQSLLHRRTRASAVPSRDTMGFGPDCCVLRYSRRRGLPPRRSAARSSPLRKEQPRHSASPRPLASRARSSPSRTKLPRICSRCAARRCRTSPATRGRRLRRSLFMPGSRCCCGSPTRRGLGRDHPRQRVRAVTAAVVSAGTSSAARRPAIQPPTRRAAAERAPCGPARRHTAAQKRWRSRLSPRRRSPGLSPGPAAAACLRRPDASTHSITVWPARAPGGAVTCPARLAPSGAVHRAGTGSSYLA